MLRAAPAELYTLQNSRNISRFARKMNKSFRFRKHASIGAAAAEDDADYLAECFVDNGDVEPLRSTKDARRIILGRTGAGKSALLSQLAEQEHCITVNPESLSFNYLTNSSVLQFFLDAGVKMDLFFKLLWRHVFTVEILKSRYQLRTPQNSKTFFDSIKTKLSGNTSKQRAIAYLVKFGDHFWEETEYRINSITHIECERRRPPVRDRRRE